MSFIPNNKLSVDQACRAWDVIELQMGAHNMINAIYQLFDTDTISYIVENLIQDYELDDGTEELYEQFKIEWQDEYGPLPDNYVPDMNSDDFKSWLSYNE
jgi:hypothetical protein